MSVERRGRLAQAVIAFTFSLFGAAANADIIDDLQPGHWATVSLNRISDVNPCPANNCSYTGLEGQSAVIDDWNGGAFATGYGSRGGLVVFGGGHNGYLGNEVYVFNLDSRMWERVSDPVVNPTCNQSSGELQDGSPCSAHTYDYVDYHPTTNSFVELGSASNHEVGGGGSPKVHLFSLDQRTWRGGASSNYPSFVSHTGASSAYDSNRDVFWVLPGYNRQLMQYDPNANGGAGSWTPYTAFNIEIDAVSSIDPDRDLLVTLDTRGTQRVIAFDLKNPNSPGVFVSTTGDTEVQSASRPGFEWDPIAKKFVAWGGGTSVYTLTPPDSGWETGTWVWTRVDAASSNTVTPSSPNSNGTYSRFRYAPAVNAFVVVNSTTDSVYMYKLSAGSGAPNPNPVAPTVSLAASPTNVTAGDPTSLSWSSSSADSCTASGGWSGSQPLSGSLPISNLQSTTNFSISCSNTVGTTTRSVTVNVSAAGPGGSDSDGDWQSRSSAPGVTLATNFDTQGDVSNWLHAVNADHVSWDESIKASGSGSLRFEIRNTDGADSGSWRRWLDNGNEFGPGDEFFVQYRQYVPAYYATHAFANGGGWKQSIISRRDTEMNGVLQNAPYGSNQLNEIVLQNTRHRGLVQGYNRDSNGSYPPWEVAAATACSATDFLFQNAVDRGPQSIGTPCENDRARYGGLYSYTQQNAAGAPDPISGGFPYYPNEWLTFMLHIKLGQYGGNSFDTEVKVYVARDGGAYDLIIDRNDIDLGNGPGHDTIWLLPYNTGRSADSSRENTFTNYDELIVSRNFIPAPGTSGSNSGAKPNTLENFNATSN